MRRALIQFDDERYRKLQQAFQEERSISSLVREMVVKTLAGGVNHKKPKQISQLLSVSAGRSKQGRLSPVSERHDEALAVALGK